MQQSTEVMALGGAVIGARIGLLEGTPLGMVRKMLHEMDGDVDAAKLLGGLLMLAYFALDMAGYAVGREILGDEVDFELSEGWGKAFFGSFLMFATLWTGLGKALAVVVAVLVIAVATIVTLNHAFKDHPLLRSLCEIQGADSWGL